MDGLYATTVDSPVEVGSIYLMVYRVLYIPGPRWLFGVCSTVTVSCEKIFTLYTHELWVILLVSKADNDQILHKKKTDIFKKTTRTCLNDIFGRPGFRNIHHHPHSKKNMDVKHSTPPPRAFGTVFLCWKSLLEVDPLAGPTKTGRPWR